MRKFYFFCLFFHASFLFADINADTVAFINKFRLKYGLSALVVDARMCALAKQHSLDMARHVVPFGHDGFEERMQKLRKIFPNFSGGAENVAYNYQTAAVVADGWMHSAGHRKNILGNYNATCVATARDIDGKIYYTQLFMRA